MAADKDYESTNAVTYLSLSLLSLVGNTSPKLSKVLSTYRWFVGFSLLVFAFSLAISIPAYIASLPDLSHVIHVEVYKWMFLMNAVLAGVFLFFWIVLCCSKSAYNLMSSYNRAVIVSVLFAYVLFVAVGTSRIFWFDSFFNVDYVTKAQLLVDLQMAIAWSDTTSTIYLLGFFTSVVSIFAITVSACPEVAIIKHSATSVKTLLNMGG